MPKFRQKPVVIEARQLTSENAQSVGRWCCGRAWRHATPLRMIRGLKIDTLEGEMHAEFGDWIIKGVQGEFYPCKPDIFEATYEPVEPAPTIPEES